MVRLSKNSLGLNDPIKRAVIRDLRHVSMDIPLNELSRVLARNAFALVEKKFFVTTLDVMDMLMNNPGK